MFSFRLSFLALLGAVSASPQPEPAAAGGSVCSQQPYVLVRALCHGLLLRTLS